jgi:hypothetical protein
MGFRVSFKSNKNILRYKNKINKIQINLYLINLVL